MDLYTEHKVLWL